MILADTHAVRVRGSIGASREIGIIGLGKMGNGIVRRLMQKGWTVHGHDHHAEHMRELASIGMKAAVSQDALIEALATPRLVWLMVPAKPKPGKSTVSPVDEVLFGPDGIAAKLNKGDVIIDGGNSFYKDTMRRAKKLEKLGITLIDVGFSGGPKGAREGGCLMIGGEDRTFRQLEPLFHDLAREDGYRFFRGAGAGHFVKMVHNGIEYGMMQAIGEGFAILKKSKYQIDVERAAEIYNRGSVIESRLVAWLKSAYKEHGKDLAAISGSVGHTGEGEWTAKTAKELKVPADIIERSFKFRVNSKRHPSYIGKVISALRGQFGGHAVKK